MRKISVEDKEIKGVRMMKVEDRVKNLEEQVVSLAKIFQHDVEYRTDKLMADIEESNIKRINRSMFLWWSGSMVMFVGALLSVLCVKTNDKLILGFFFLSLFVMFFVEAHSQESKLDKFRSDEK